MDKMIEITRLGQFIEEQIAHCRAEQEEALARYRAACRGEEKAREMQDEYHRLRYPARMMDEVVTTPREARGQ
jgi:hypothetical protein